MKLGSKANADATVQPKHGCAQVNDLLRRGRLLRCHALLVPVRAVPVEIFW